MLGRISKNPKKSGLFGMVRSKSKHPPEHISVPSSKVSISHPYDDHPYDDDDMSYANEARNLRDGFSYLKISGQNDSNILIKKVDPGASGSFFWRGEYYKLVNDGICGITMEMPNGYTIDPQGAFSYRDTFRVFLETQGEYIGSLRSLGVKSDPIKILFPYRVGIFHWNAAEVIIKCSENQIFATAYDPYGTTYQLPSEITDQVKGFFGMLSAEVKKTSTTISKVQFGGLFCGGYSGRGVHNLKTKTATHIWDGIVCSGRVKSDPVLRVEDRDLVREHGTGTAQTNFLATRGDTSEGALYSDASPVSAAASSTKAPLEKKMAEDMKKFHSRLSADDLKALAVLVDGLRSYGLVADEFKQELRSFLKQISECLDKKDTDGDKLTVLNSVVSSFENIKEIFKSCDIKNIAFYEEIVSNFATLEHEESRGEPSKPSDFISFYEIPYSEKPSSTTVKTFFQCDLSIGNEGYNFSRPFGVSKPKAGISHEYGEAVSNGLQMAEECTGFKPEEIAVIILVAIRKQGFTGKNNVELIEEFGKIYKSGDGKISGALPEKDINDDFIAAVRKFSKTFQDCMKEQNFLTGNEKALNPEVGTRLKRLTPIHAQIYCGNRDFVMAAEGALRGDTPSRSPSPEGAASSLRMGRILRESISNSASI